MFARNGRLGGSEDEFILRGSFEQGTYTLDRGSDPNSDINQYYPESTLPTGYSPARSFHISTATTSYEGAIPHPGCYNGSEFFMQQSSPCRQTFLNTDYGELQQASIVESCKEVPPVPGPQPPLATEMVSEPVAYGESWQHIANHAVDYKCGRLGCTGQSVGHSRCFHPGRPLPIVCSAHQSCRSVFRTQRGYNRHCEAKHRGPGVFGKEKLSCPFPDCKRVKESGFTRPDNLRQHRRNVHGENIPKERRMFSGSNSRAHNRRD